MFKKASKTNLLLWSFLIGLMIAFVFRVFLKTTLNHAFEYTGAIFFLVALLFFIPSGISGKTDSLKFKDHIYILIFGLIGLAFLTIPIGLFILEKL